MEKSTRPAVDLGSSVSGHEATHYDGRRCEGHSNPDRAISTAEGERSRCRAHASRPGHRGRSNTSAGHGPLTVSATTPISRRLRVDVMRVPPRAPAGPVDVADRGAGRREASAHDVATRTGTPVEVRPRRFRPQLTLINSRVPARGNPDTCAARRSLGSYSVRRRSTSGPRPPSTAAATGRQPTLAALTSRGRSGTCRTSCTGYDSDDDVHCRPPAQPQRHLRRSGVSSPRQTVVQDRRTREICVDSLASRPARPAVILREGDPAPGGAARRSRTLRPQLPRTSSRRRSEERDASLRRPHTVS